MARFPRSYSPDRLLKKHLWKLEKSARQRLKNEFKSLLKRRPRPRLPEPRLPEPPFTLFPGKAHDIEIEGKTVRVVGLPAVPKSSPGADVDVGGLVEEINKAILEEITELVEREGLLDDDEED